MWTYLGPALEGVEGSIWVMITLFFLVASLGIVNTLTMNINEQTREMGVLRAIGVRRIEVGKMVLAQALIIGIVSVLPGVAAGLGLTYQINIAKLYLTGRTMAYPMYPGFVAGCAALALVIAVAAAILPARRAARLQIIEALRYE